jgi:hypothetical protein
MRSMSKLALLTGIGAPLMLVSASVFAQGPTAPPSSPAPTAPATSPGYSPTPSAPPSAASPATTPAVSTPAAPAPAAAHDNTDYGPAGPPEPTAPHAADGLVKIHIMTKELVTLEHRSGANAPWQHACETPCDTRLPPADEYRIVGEGVAESSSFSLTTPKGDEVKIHVAPGLKSKAKIGEVLTFTGAVLVVGAIVVGVGAADPSSVFNASGQTDNYNWNVIEVATGIAVTGVVAGILGGAWWYDNSHTRVAGDLQENDQRSPPPPVRGGLEPAYQTGMRLSGPGLGVPSYTAPLFTTSF